MRAAAIGGLSPTGLPTVSGGEDSAKETVMSSTVATFTAASLPVLTPPTTPPPPTLPAVTQPPLYPGGNAQETAPGSTPTLTGGTPPPPPPIKPSGILLYGDTDTAPFQRSRSALEADLRAFQPNVLVTNLNGPTLPADLSAYGSIWYVGAFTPLSTSDQTKLAQFLARGGGLYMTAEQEPCVRCRPANETVQDFVRQVTGVSGINVGAPGDFPLDPKTGLLPVASFNPSARGQITTSPNRLTIWAPDGPGIISGISNGNVLATIGESIVAGVWSSSDLTGNAGRMVLIMDVDWLSGEMSLSQCSAACR